MTILVRLCDIVASVVFIVPNMKKANLSGYVLEIQNVCILLNNSTIKEVRIEDITFQANVGFILV